MIPLLWIYNLLFPIVLLLLLPGFLVRMVRRGNYRHKFGQRFGFYSGRVRQKLSAGGWIWIHAVSVGEMMIALRLVSALRERLPNSLFVLSTTTSTGYRLAHRHRSSWLEPIYYPLDFRWTMRRAFQWIRPRALVMVEAEVWPNAVQLASQAGIPKILVNTRLSARSEKRYRLLCPLPALLFNSLDRILLQDASDLPRWLNLGIAREKLEVTGSIKFDLDGAKPGTPRDFRPFLKNLGIEEDDPILLGGSTFDGEEEMLAEVAQRLRDRWPRLLLILCPRHAERCPEILLRLRAAHHHVQLRSEPEPSHTRPHILLINTTGELADWYRCATVVFIGKSLSPVARGGQNPVEPIVANKPVLFGPNMQNFQPLASQLIEAQGAIEVRSPSQLFTKAAQLIEAPSRRQDCVRAALACLNQHRGATRRTAAALAALLESSTTS